MTLKGIDVSGWQQGINLAAVPAWNTEVRKW